MQNNYKQYSAYHTTGRIYWLGAFFSLILFSIVLRFFYIQVISRDPWISLAPAQYENRIRLSAKRGIIYDRQKNILAMDLPNYSLAADPTMVQNAEKTALFISTVLGGDPQKYSKLLSTEKHTQFIKIADELSEDQRHQFQSQGMRELIINRERKRSYPFTDLARPFIGLTDARHTGVAGIELAFNDLLAGQDGWTILQRDGMNRNFSTVDYPVEAALDGKHVVLTLDYVYQTILEEELHKGVMRYDSKWGSAVLIHPVTGEILAMASLIGPRLESESPDFQTSIRNWAIQDNYEPGSVFKVVVLAAALQEGIVTPQSLVYCENGSYIINGNRIGDDHRSFQWLTVQQAIEVSSNIAMSKIAKQLGKQKFYRYIQDFGFGNRTGIDLPGEASGLLRPPYQWDDFLTATTAFGQGLSVTTLQLACMTAAIANGGELIKPQIYKAIIDDQSHQLEKSRPEVIRRVISQETAHKVIQILESSVREGTGKRAEVPGLHIAGKTGTAQKSMPGVEGYIPGANVSSFIGFWPAQSPEFVLVVTLDEPKYESISSQSAAPIFARIAERISGLPRNPQLPEPKREGSFSVFTMSSYRSQESEQSAPAQMEIQSVSPYFVPDLIGLSVRQAMRKLAICGIQAQIEGHGTVIKQDLKAGMRVQEDMVCRLVCQ